MKRKTNCVCTVCSKSIYRRPVHLSNGPVFCSSACFGISQRKLRQCPICKGNYTGYKKTCSRKCANKQRTGIKYTRLGLFDRAYQGRLIKEKVAADRNGLCERCGEPNYSILQVHHKKERYRGGTDDLSNLELLCPNCHATHHLGKSLWRAN